MRTIPFKSSTILILLVLAVVLIGTIGVWVPERSRVSAEAPADVRGVAGIEPRGTGQGESDSEMLAADEPSEDLLDAEYLAALDQTIALKSQPRKVPQGARPGFYAARDNRYLSASEYNLVGGHQSYTWEDLEPNENDYRWDLIDGFIAQQIATGKQAVGIGVVTNNGRLLGGIKVPDWVFARGSRKIVCDDGWQIQRFWDPIYLQHYEDLIEDLAARYDNDSRVEFVQIGVGIYMETQPSDTEHDDACVIEAMVEDNPTWGAYTWPYMVNDIVDIYVRHFHNTSLLLLNEPTFVHEGTRKQWTDHAVANGVGLQPAGLHADREWTDLRLKPGWHGIGRYDHLLDQAEENAFMTWNPVPVAHELYDYMIGGHTDLGVLPDPRLFFWAVGSALSRRADYITVERNALYAGRPSDPVVTPMQEHIRFMGWAGQYLGKYVDETPSVFVLMRESAYKSSIYPQQGNYSFWLTQDDSVAGGQSKVVSYRRESELYREGLDSSYVRADIISVDDDPSLSALQSPDLSDPMDFYPSYKGWIARRTDQASGSPRMYFKIDDRYFTGGPAQATIKVTYFDKGTDSWRLVGHDGVGATVVLDTVAKTNSNRWKTRTTNVASGFFSNMLLGADFYIDSQSNGDEYIHMVDFRTGSSGGTTQQINLSSNDDGWNFVSLNVIPDSTAVASVLNSIAGKYTVVQAYSNGAWRSYVPGAGGALTTIDEKMGFWIQVNQNCTLSVRGQAPSSTTIHLTATNGGWNLISWPADGARSVPTALAGISGYYDLVYGYDALDTADHWEVYSPIAPPYASDLTVFRPGFAYWIHVAADCDLVIGY